MIAKKIGLGVILLLIIGVTYISKTNEVAIKTIGFTDINELDLRHELTEKGEIIIYLPSDLKLSKTRHLFERYLSVKGGARNLSSIFRYDYNDQENKLTYQFKQKEKIIPKEEILRFQSISIRVPLEPKN